MLPVAEAASVASGMGAAFEGIKGDIINGLGTVAPYAVAIVGAFLVWKYGIKFFKGLAGK